MLTGSIVVRAIAAKVPHGHLSALEQGLVCHSAVIVCYVRDCILGDSNEQPSGTLILPIAPEKVLGGISVHVLLKTMVLWRRERRCW